MFQAPMAFGRTVLFQDSPVCSRATQCELVMHSQIPFFRKEGLAEGALPQVNRSMHRADIMLTGQWQASGRNSAAWHPWLTGLAVFF